MTDRSKLPSEWEEIEPGMSDMAKAVAGAWFGSMVPGKGDLTFHLNEARPSDDAQRGLNELVAAGAISVEQFNNVGGLTYRPLVDMRVQLGWLLANRSNPVSKTVLTTPLASRAEGRRVQKAALRAQAEALS